MIKKKKSILDSIRKANQKHTQLTGCVKAVKDRSSFNELKKDLLKACLNYDKEQRYWGREVEMDTLLTVSEKLLLKGIRLKDVSEVVGISIDDIKLCLSL